MTASPPYALPDVIRCPAGCGATVANTGRTVDTDDRTVTHLRASGWQVVDGRWTCPNDLPADRRDLPGAMGRPRNPYCTRCGDTRGGAYGHDGSECTWGSGEPGIASVALVGRTPPQGAYQRLGNGAAVQRAAAPQVPLTLDALINKMGWTRGYAEHLVQPYCECWDGMDGWEYCQHARDLGLTP